MLMLYGNYCMHDHKCCSSNTSCNRKILYAYNPPPPSTPSPFYITTQSWSIAIIQYSISMFQMRFMSILSYVVINPFSCNLKLLSPVMDHVTVLFVGIYIFEYVNFNNIVIVIVISVISYIWLWTFACRMVLLHSKIIDV